MTQPVIRDFIAKYKSTPLKRKDILREILQQSALLGLARHRFFEHAAFYGGTALRILYGLDRFSEDLDFSLLKPDPKFEIQPYLDALKKEMESFGFAVDVQSKKNEQPILSAFVKSNTLKLLLTIEEEPIGIHPDEKIMIKLEIDANPPLGFTVESKLVLHPVPFYVLTYQPQDLFAGKLHAVLCRNWKTRIKGRDWYDLIWFAQKGTLINLAHLTNRMHQSGHLAKSKQLTHDSLIEHLSDRICQIDWEMAKDDVRAFVADPEALDIWSKTFFLDLLGHLKSQA